LTNKRNFLIKYEFMTGKDENPAVKIERPSSPCVLLCTLDDQKFCLGCGRSLAQISGWALMTAEEQWHVVDELAARRAKNDATIAAESGD
jgi:predicted Fe-S protein YdhL (DUF1289 family)